MIQAHLECRRIGSSLTPKYQTTLNYLPWRKHSAIHCLAVSDEEKVL
jgi:hypothetical protein